VATAQHIRLLSFRAGPEAISDSQYDDPPGPFRGVLLVQLRRGRGRDVDPGPLKLVPFVGATQASCSRSPKCLGDFDPRTLELTAMGTQHDAHRETNYPATDLGSLDREVLPCAFSRTAFWGWTAIGAVSETDLSNGILGL